MLVMPVQRIPRYVLLLKEIIKHTHKEDPELPELQQGLEKVQSVAQEINTRLRESENRAVVGQILSQLDMGSAKDKTELPFNLSRLFVLEGELTEHMESTVGQCYCYLFNDILIAASTKKRGRAQLRSVDEVILLETCTPAVEIALGDAKHPVTASDPIAHDQHRRRRNSRTLSLTSDTSTDKTDLCAFGLSISGVLHVLSAKDNVETRKWMTEINKYIADVNEKYDKKIADFEQQKAMKMKEKMNIF